MRPVYANPQAARKVAILLSVSHRGSGGRAVNFVARETVRYLTFISCEQPVRPLETPGFFPGLSPAHRIPSRCLRGRLVCRILHTRGDVFGPQAYYVNGATKLPQSDAAANLTTRARLTPSNGGEYAKNTRPIVDNY